VQEIYKTRNYPKKQRKPIILKQYSFVLFCNTDYSTLSQENWRQCYDYLFERFTPIFGKKWAFFKNPMYYSILKINQHYFEPKRRIFSPNIWRI
jgi:hypothetical protein